MDVKLAVKIKNLQREADALGVKITCDPPLTILDWVDTKSDENEMTAKYKGFTLCENSECSNYCLECADGTTIKRWVTGFDLFEQEAIALVDSIVASVEKI